MATVIMRSTNRSPVSDRVPWDSFLQMTPNLRLLSAALVTVQGVEIRARARVRARARKTVA